MAKAYTSLSYERKMPKKKRKRYFTRDKILPHAKIYIAVTKSPQNEGVL